MQDFMSDAEYDAIKATFPTWAARVERAADRVATGVDIAYYQGLLFGLAQAMVLTKQCGRAYMFAEKAERKLKDEKSRVNTCEV